MKPKGAISLQGNIVLASYKTWIIGLGEQYQLSSLFFLDILSGRERERRGGGERDTEKTAKTKQKNQQFK